MTRLADLLQPSPVVHAIAQQLAGTTLDIDSLAASIATSVQPGSSLGAPAAILASCRAWINQDDDAHEVCSITACRAPLHPGPCKGWKHTLHAVSPGAYRQLEEERVRKANERRLKRIADLKAQNKPIPRRLLEEIKVKPAPVAAVPLGQVGQKADLAGGQAHHAGQAVSNAAGVAVKTPPPLPLGPKAKKPTVAGRGPAFVITQPKVTDQYKLDKADKITPQEWAALSDADKTTIRNELTAIKARGFGPQQTRADALLAKLPAPTVAKPPAAPSAPAAPHAPAVPGKVSLGQAVKTVPAVKPSGAPTGGTRTPPSLDLHRAWATHSSPHSSSMSRVAAWEKVSRAEFDTLTAAQQKSVLGDLRDIKTHGALQDAARASDLLKKFGTPGGHLPNTPDPAAKAKAAAEATTLAPAAKVFVYKKLDKRAFDSLDDTTKQKILGDIDHQIANGSPTQRTAAVDLKARLTGPGVSVAPATHAPSAPAAPHAPSAPSAPHVSSAPGVKPSAPLPATSSAAAKHAHAVANRTAPKATLSKIHIDSYGKLTKAEFDALPPDTQKTIRDDLANAKNKFLDPKKQQVAKDLLDRFGSTHPVTVPAAPGGAKGYSDPMNQAVKAVESGDRGTALARVSVLSKSNFKDMTKADQDKILTRLDAIRANPNNSDVHREAAADLHRIITSGSKAETSRKWDHEPSFGELALAEKPKHAAVDTRVEDAMKAARSTLGITGAPNMTRPDRVKALTSIDKAQFDALPEGDRRTFLAAMLHLHTDQKANGMSVRDATIEKAFTQYTGQHPAIHRLQQAESDFRSGRITGDQVHSAFLHANVQVGHGATEQATRTALEAEARRIAEDNPNLPTYVRVRMAGDAKYGPTTYNAIGLAGMEHNWQKAPRLSQNDANDIFRPTEADMANVHPIHAQAIRDLQQHVLKTGLDPNSPWSDSTKQMVVQQALGVDYSKPIIKDERLAFFNKLPVSVQNNMIRTLHDKVGQINNDHDKTAVLYQISQLRGTKLTPAQDAAVRVAMSHSFFQAAGFPAYRNLDPKEFDALAGPIQGAILDHLHVAQKAAESSPKVHWQPTDDPLKVMPDALAEHLTGLRTAYASRMQNVSVDMAQNGRGIIVPEDRVRQYALMGDAKFSGLSQAHQRLIDQDLTSVANDSRNPLQTRYAALYTKDVALSPHGLGNTFDAQQIHAVDKADPTPGLWSDADVAHAFNGLSKGSYDKLDPVYREAIDEKIKGLPGPQQQALMAKFHPNIAPVTPAGYTPTAPAAVPPHVQAALDTIYGVHPKSHTMAHQLTTYGALRGHDFGQLNAQEQNHLLSDLSFIATTAKGPSADKARKLIDRFTPAGTPHGQVPTPPVIPPANSVPGQVRYATPLTGTLHIAKDKGRPGDGWTTTPGGKRVWGKYGAAGLLLMHQDPVTGERRYLMVQRGPAISDPGKWQFPGGAIDEKETFHQGGAREVIEELGFDKNALANAQVHGEHTNSIPGSSWKYVSVAAQVPTMLKPDLSTHHARAETSDAKWMTEAEIRKLDTDGKLLAPLAGGKLEQNVLSLFPGAGQTKLGNVIARPGPVTKRQGRLSLPPGGRVPPAQFNAWPHAHKPSKGKNLVGDKTAIDKLRQDVKHARTAYDGKTADGRLAAIGAMQGYDDTPTVVSKSEMDRLLATGDYIEVWRGVKGTGSSRYGGKSAADINEDMRSGTAYYGKGIFGNGYYLATQRSVARQYSDGTKNSVLRALIPKSAVMAQYDQMQREAHAASSPTSKAKGARFEQGTLYDPGRWAAAKGIDGIEIQHHHTSPGGWARHVAASGKPAYNWLNRSVLIIQEAE